MKTLHIDENLLEYKDLVSLPVTHDVVLFDLKYGIREPLNKEMVEFGKNPKLVNPPPQF